MSKLIDLVARCQEVLCRGFPPDNRAVSHVHRRETPGGGSAGQKGASRAGPRVDLPLRRYLLLRHKRGPLGEKHQERKARAENESAPSSQGRRLRSVPHDHSVIHEYHLRHGKSFL